MTEGQPKDVGAQVDTVSMIGQAGRELARKLQLISLGQMTIKEAGPGFFHAGHGIGITVDQQTWEALHPEGYEAPPKEPERTITPVSLSGKEGKRVARDLTEISLGLKKVEDAPGFSWGEYGTLTLHVDEKTFKAIQGIPDNDELNDGGVV